MYIKLQKLCSKSVKIRITKEKQKERQQAF